MAEALRSDPAGRSTALLFQLDKKCWALDAAFVARVLPNQPARPAGFLPLQFSGVVAYAGEVLPLLDLRTRLNLPESESPAGELLVLTFGAQSYALRVERVIQIVVRNEGQDLIWRGQTVTFIDVAAVLLDALEETASAPPQAPTRNRAIEPIHPTEMAELPGLDEIRAATAASLVVETASGRERLPRYSVVELCEDLPRVAVPDPRLLFQGAAFYRDQLLPIVSLDRLLGRTGQEPSADKVFVIVDVAGRLCAISVKSVVGMSNEPVSNIDLRALLLEHLPEGAERLAMQQQRPAETPAEEGTRFLVTEAAGRPCGFSLDSVIHIHAASAVIRAPRTQGAAPIGVAAIAGRVMPVLDLPDSLGLGQGATRQQFIEFASPDEGNFAVAVDRVVGISSIAPSALLPAPRGSNISAVVSQGDASLLWIIDAVLLAQSLQGGAHVG
ncbi:MAG: chemotaxis protein CheW [Methylovirgula sp.]|jgi:chemotaxis signal transduction protein